MNIKIAVAHHKEGLVLHDDRLLPIHAGKVLSSKELGIQGDNTFENISEKNPWYCELTALYWLWKNVDADYKGLIHYRRTFAVDKMFFIKHLSKKLKFIARRLTSLWSPYSSLGVTYQKKCSSEESFSKTNKAFLDSMESDLRSGVNVIAPYPVKFYFPVRRTICWEVGGYFMDIMDDIVRTEYPDFYPYYNKAQNGLYFHNANMEVMDRATHNEYCSLLFGILRRHEEETVKRGYLIDVSKEKSYSRVSGYLAEMLTNAFLQYCMSTKNVKIYPVAMLSV